MDQTIPEAADNSQRVKHVRGKDAAAAPRGNGLIYETRLVDDFYGTISRLEWKQLHVLVIHGDVHFRTFNP